MGGHVPAAMIRDVRERAQNCCEYCLLPQHSQEATFHVDHVVPRAKQGKTILDNLALACVSCSLRKAARQRALDPETSKFTRLFNPRIDEWSEHFQITKKRHVSGRTSIGRATIEALAMNRTTIVAIREELAQLDKYPPRNQ